jgi:hypothetical protein
MKRFLSLWTLLLCFIGGAFADEVMINFPEKWSSTTDMTTLSASDLKWGDIQLAFADGGNTNPPKYYNTGSAVRIYKNNTMTITAPAAKPITEVVFLFDGEYVAEAGNFSAGTLSGTIWTGSASTIVITNNKASGQIRICSIKITFGAGGDDPAPGPQLAEGAIIDFPTAKTGITIKSSTDGQVKYNTVKIHNNTDAVDCIQFGKSFKYTDTEYFYALLETEGGFKKGDVISIAGVYNNADTKNAAIAFYADPAGDAIWTTENFINSRSSADDPVAQTFTLTENADKLYIGRKGNTGTCITDLKVLRGFITISPAPGDIFTAYNAAVDGIEGIKKVTINLEKDGAYTISQPLVASAGIIINGNGATIDASALEAAMITTPAGDLAEWQEGSIIIKDANIKGVKKGVFASARKNFLYKVFTIDNCVIEIASTNGFEFDFRKGSVAENFNILNSTIYAPEATKNSLYTSQSAQKGTEAPGVTVQTFTIENSILYNLAKSKNFFTHRQSNQKWLAFTLKNNIFVNCGKSGQVVKGVNGGSNGANPIWTIDGNVFNFDGADTSAAESTGDADEPVQNSIAGLVMFTDAAKGDFNGTLAYEAEKALEKAPGDPRWTIALRQQMTLWSSATPVAVGWGQPAAVLPADQTGVIEVGDVLHLSISDVPAGATQWNWQAQARIEDGSWTDLGFGQALAEGQTEVTFVISGILAQIIHEKGMQIRGTGFSANKLVLEKGVYSGSDNSVWVGKQALTWTQVNVGGALFQTAGAEVGKALEIYFDRGEAVPNVQLRTSWNDGDQFYGSMYDGPSPLRIPLTEELAEKLKKNQLIINANDITVTSVEVNTYTDIATAAKKADKEEFVYNAEAIVVAKVMKNNSAYVYIMDNSGYGLIYDKDGSKTAALEVGKTIKPDWKGQVSIYNGLFEIVPQEELAMTDAAPVAEEDLYTKANSLKVFNNKDNVNRVYKIENVTLSEINKSNFTVKRGTITAAGYNQFSKNIEEGLVCDVLASVGFYVDKEGNETVQFQPIEITVKPSTLNIKVSVSAGGDINAAIAKARSGKNTNPKTLTINLAKGSYTISKPIIAYGDVIINGKGANIDASGLTTPMIQMSKYPSVAGTAVGSVTAYQVGNVELNEINVDNLSQNLFDCNKTQYLFENVTLNKSIIAIKGASNKTIFNFNGGGNTKNLTVSGSTLYADDATTWQNGGFYSSQSGSSVDQLGGTEQKTTIENSTLYNICKGKTTSTRRKDSQKWMTYEVKNCIIVNSGKSGQFLAGLNKGQKGDNSNWIVDNSSFTYDGQDVAATEATKIKDDVMTNTVYGAPMFRKLWASDGTMTGDFTLGVCRQATKQIGDPRWYQIPQITGLQNALQKAAALLDGAQADWQSAPAADEAIEKLAGAYNENAPYLNSYYQEEIDEATLRVEAAIAEFEKVYGSDVTAIKSVDALKADGTWYTINGQRISTPTEKGIYIHNGKKVVVK